VVEQLHAEDPGGLGHPAGEREVLEAGRGIAARARLEQDDRVGSKAERRPEDRPGLDGGLRDRAPEDLLGLQEAWGRDVLRRLAGLEPAGADATTRR
jgi:hypothetical protein